jgi:hypothetical protein
MKKHSQLVIVASFTVLALVGLLSPVSAQQALYRLSSDFQWNPPAVGQPVEFITDVSPGAGGLLVYSKTMYSTLSVWYISFDAAAAAHNGATLVMKCAVNGIDCIAPGASGGSPESAAIPPGWVGLLKTSMAIPILGIQDPNCTTNHINPPGSDPSEYTDCHTNNINYTWCAIVGPGTHTVELKLASVAGPDVVLGAEDKKVHYERAHITIDATKQPTSGPLCQPAAYPPVPFTPPGFGD